MIYKVTSAGAARSISRYLLLALSIAGCLLRSGWMDAAGCKTAADTTHFIQAVRPFTSIEQSTVQSVDQVDRSTGLVWVRVTNCEHPDWPAHLVLSPGTTPPMIGQIGRHTSEFILPRQPQPVVRAGQTVRLWCADDMFHFEVDAIAEETKGAGDRIRVRLSQAATSYNQEPARHLVGVVRDRGSVELVQ